MDEPVNYHQQANNVRQFFCQRLQQSYNFLRRSFGFRGYTSGMRKGRGLVWKKGVSFLTCALLGTQCLLAYQSETNFWAERHRSSKLQRTSIHPSRDNSLLLSSLPSAVPVGLTTSARIPSEFQPDSVSLPAAPLSGHSSITRRVLRYGTLLDAYVSKTPDAPLIIHIQDAHGIEEAQRNMAAMIQDLSEKQGVSLVGLEAAQGAFELAPFRNWPDASVRRDVAESFLKEDRIGGPEFAGITALKPLTLWGIEDTDLYLANVQALKDANTLKPELTTFLTDINKAVSSLKDTFYSQELKDFDRHFQAYQDQKEGLGSYVRYLTRVKGKVSIDRYPNLHLLVKALASEDSLDFKRVERERLELVERLTLRLPKQKLDLLVQRSLQYRAGQLVCGEYQRFLKWLCRDNNVPLDDLPQLSQYIEYVLLAERIDRNKFLEELAGAEREAQGRMVSTTAQKQLVSVARRLALLGKLSAQAMTPDDWSVYEKEREDILKIAATVHSLSARGRPLGRVSLAALLKPSEAFCRIAVRRNASFVENLSAQMKAQKTSAAVLVAGGFHSSGLARLFRQKDISYMVVTPKITEVPQGNNYLDVFARDPLPLEKLFSGQTIFMNFARLTAAKVTPGFENAAKALGNESLTDILTLQVLKDSQAGKRVDLNSLATLTNENAQGAGLPLRVDSQNMTATREFAVVRQSVGKNDTITLAVEPGQEAVARKKVGMKTPLASSQIGGKTFYYGLQHPGAGDSSLPAFFWKRIMQPVTQRLLKNKTVREDLFILAAGYTSLALSAPWFLPILLLGFIAHHIKNIEIDLHKAMNAGHLDGGNVKAVRDWKIQYVASLIVNALILNLLLLGPGIIMTLNPSLMAAVVWGLPILGILGHGKFSPWAFSRLMDPSAKWVFAPLTISREPSIQNPKVYEINNSPLFNQNQAEVRRKFKLYQDKLINSNFAALELINLHMESMSRGVAEAILGHVEQMVDVFVEIDSEKGQRIREVFENLQNSLEPGLARLADNVELSPEMIKVLTTGMGENQWSEGQPIITVRALINCIHQQGAEAIRNVIKNAHANTVIEVSPEIKINVANLSESPLFEDGRIMSRPLKYILHALNKSSRTDPHKETYVIVGNYLSWSSKFGNHRAEVSADLEDPDNGGYFRIRYFEGKNERANELRLIYFISILEQLGVFVAPRQTNQFGQYVLDGILDKDHGATKIDQIATALTLAMSALHDSKSLDHSLDAIGVRQSSEYVEKTALHMADIFLAEGRLPFFREAMTRWDEALYRAYLAYMAQEDERTAQREKLNERLKSWNLPLIPTDIVFGERVLENKYTDVVERALARGQLVMGEDGTPEKNPLYDPIPELVRFVLENEGEAMQAALTFDPLSQDMIPCEPMGTVGNLLAMTGQMELVTGEWIVVRGLRDPTRGHLLYAALYRGDGKGGLIPLDLKKFVKLMKKEGHSLVVADEPSPPQKMVARRLLSAPFKGSRGAVVLRGLAASAGGGKTISGEVTFNRNYLDDNSGGAGAVLVVPFTTPDDLDVIKSLQTVGLVTTGGGLLSHAGITTREFQKTAVILPGAELRTVDGKTILRASVFRVGETEIDEHGLWISKSVTTQEVEIREGDVVQVNGRDGVVTVFDRQSQYLLKGVLARLKSLTAGQGNLEEFSRWLTTSMNVGTFPSPVIPDMLEFIFSAVFETAISQKTGMSREILDRVVSLRKQVIPPEAFRRLNAVIQGAFEDKKRRFQVSLERVAHQVEETKQPDQTERVINQLLKRLQELTDMAYRLSIGPSERNELMGLEVRLKLIRQLNRAKIVRMGIKVHQKARQLIEKPLEEEDLPQIRQLLRVAERHGFPSGKIRKVVCVCTGNTDRSPMAESLLKRLLNEKGRNGVTVISRGLQTKIGQPISRNAKIVLDEMSSSHVASRLTAEDLEGADLVLAMTQEHVDSLLALYPELKGKVARLKDYGEIEGGGDVEDPFGKDMATYLQTKEEIDLAVKGVLNRMAGAEALGKLVAKEKALTGRKLHRIEQAHRSIYALGELDEDFVGVCGGKSAKLGQIHQLVTQLGMDVPKLLALTTTAFDRYLDENTGMREEFYRLTRELDAHLQSGFSITERKEIVHTSSDQIRNLISSGRFDMGKGLGAEILQALADNEMETEYLAERSSAIQEDTQAAAFAGAAETFHYVPPEEHLEKIKEIWMSFFLPRGIEYRAAHGIRQADVQPATNLQIMVDADVAGAVFSVNPVTGEDEVVINSSWGLGESIVSGLVQGDIYTTRKSDGAEIDFPFIGNKRTKIIRHESGAGTKTVAVDERDRNRRSLTPSQVAQLTKLVTILESYFGYPVDIEFAISKGRIALLQVRPVTTTDDKGSVKRDGASNSLISGALGLWTKVRLTNLPLIGIVETFIYSAMTLIIFLVSGMPQGPPVFDLNFVWSLIQSSVMAFFAGYPLLVIAHRVFGVLQYDFLSGEYKPQFSLPLSLRAALTASTSLLSTPFLIVGLALWSVSWPLAVAVMATGVLLGAALHARRNAAAERNHIVNLFFQKMPVQVSARTLPNPHLNKREFLQKVLQRYLLGQTAAPVGFDVSLKGKSQEEDLATLRDLAQTLGVSEPVSGESEFIQEMLRLLDHDGVVWDTPAKSLEVLSSEKLNQQGLSDGERSIEKVAQMVKRRVSQFAVLDAKARVSQRDAFIRAVEPFLAVLHHLDRSFLHEVGFIGMSNGTDGQAMDMAFVLNLAYGDELKALNQDQAKGYNQTRERANQWGLDTRDRSFAQALKENRPVVVNISEIFEEKKDVSPEDRAILFAKLKATLSDLKTAMEKSPESQSVVGFTVRDKGVTEESIKALADEELKGLIETLRGPSYSVRWLVGHEVVDEATGKLSVRQVAASLGSQGMPVIYTVNEEDWMDLQYGLVRILLSAGLVRNATADVLEESKKVNYLKLQA